MPKDKKGAALDEEAQETKAATEAEENADEAAADATNGKAADTRTNGNGADVSTKVKATVMPIENKAKSAAPPAVKKPEPKDPKDGRTRRVQPKPE